MNNNIITVNNLVAQYGERVILDDVSVSMPKNKISVILGTSGCGKTTLLKNILRLQHPAGGRVSIFEDDVTDWEDEQFETILQRVGMLFQNGALLNSLDIYENLCIPLEQHTSLPQVIMDEIIRVKLQLVGLLPALHLFPSELSGGMKKRAALARAIALDPELLFCDEPSAGLDPVTSASLDELILKLKGELGMSIVVVTHELASIHRIADHIIFLDQGKLLYQGPLAEAKTAGIATVEHFFKVGGFL